MHIFKGLFNVPQTLSGDVFVLIKFFAWHTKTWSKGFCWEGFGFVFLGFFVSFLFFCGNIYLLLGKSLTRADKIAHPTEKNFLVFFRKNQIGLKNLFLNTNIHAQKTPATYLLCWQRPKTQSATRNFMFLVVFSKRIQLLLVTQPASVNKDLKSKL